MIFQPRALHPAKLSIKGKSRIKTVSQMKSEHFYFLVSFIRKFLEEDIHEMRKETKKKKDVGNGMVYKREAKGTLRIMGKDRPKTKAAKLAQEQISDWRG